MFFKYCNRAQFSSDMNADGVFTITDVGLILKQVFLLPADMATGILFASDDLVRFFEMNCNTGTSYGGAVFSFIAWAALLGAVSSNSA
jgi:hypothetical protein